jgi:hypothetical protein
VKAGALSIFSECEPVPDGSSLRQGDVIRPLESDNDPWNGIAIVVTADCDLARSKHAGRLTCVPVLPASTYLSFFYMPRRLARTRETLGDQLVSQMRKAQKAHLPEFSSPLTPERCRQWILQSELAKIVSALHLSAEEAAAFMPLAQSFRRISDSVDSPLSKQCEAFSSTTEAMGKSAHSTKERLIAELASHLRDLPGDAMFLSSLMNGVEEGYVAYLRLLVGLNDRQVATRAAQRSFQITHERFTHLKSPYLYRLTQQLGAVFSAIGLPEEYEASRDGRAKQFLQELG